MLRHREACFPVIAGAVPPPSVIARAAAAARGDPCGTGSSAGGCRLAPGGERHGLLRRLPPPRNDGVGASSKAVPIPADRRRV